MEKSLVKFTHMPFLLMGMMACLTMSCSQDMESNIEKKTTLGGEVSLNFSANEHGTHGTRGTMYDAITFIPNDDQFGVQGYTNDEGFEKMGNDPNFIDNGHTTKNGKVVAKNAAVWSNAKKYVQMVGTYPFLKGDNSIVKMGKDTYKVTFTPETDVRKEKDLMLGKSDIKVELVDGDREPVNIKLHHALTAVNFTLGDKRTTGLKIVGIKLSGVAGKSECKANLATNTFDWEVIEKEKTYSLKVGGAGIRTTVQNMTQVTGIKDSEGKYDNFSFLMIPQKLGPNAKATIYLETDTNPNEEDDEYKKYPTISDTRKNRKIVTLNLAGKEWKANEPTNYIIEDKQYNTDLEYVFKANNLINGKCVSRDISVSGRTLMVRNEKGDLVKATTKEQKKNAKKYYTNMRGDTPGVFEIKKIQSFAAGIHYLNGKKDAYIFPARQTWKITKYEWTCDDDTRGSSTTRPDWLECKYTEKNTPRTFGGDFTFTTNPNTCPKKLIRIDVMLKQAGNDKELKFILGFLLPYPYKKEDVKLPIPVDDVKNIKLK